MTTALIIGGAVQWTVKEKTELPHNLGAWVVWHQRNNCVLNGSSSLSTALVMAADEAQFWSMAVAKAFSLLASATQV